MVGIQSSVRDKPAENINIKYEQNVNGDVVNFKSTTSQIDISGGYFCTNGVFLCKRMILLQ